MIEEKLVIDFQKFTTYTELDGNLMPLYENALKAAQNAYAPYSNFKVGSAVLMGNGSIVTGSNKENASYPAGICAERSALFAAMDAHPGERVTAVAVVCDQPDDRPPSPCGICRQVLVECERSQNHSILLICANTSGRGYVVNRSESLLPLAFRLT